MLDTDGAIEYLVEMMAEVNSARLTIGERWLVIADDQNSVQVYEWVPRKGAKVLYDGDYLKKALEVMSEA